MLAPETVAALAAAIEARHAVAVGSFEQVADHLDDIRARLRFALDNPDAIHSSIREFCETAQVAIGSFNDAYALARDLREKATPPSPMPRAPIDKAGALDALRFRLADAADVARADLVSLSGILREEEDGDAQDVVNLARRVLAHHDTLRDGFREAFEVDGCHGSA